MKVSPFIKFVVIPVAVFFVFNRLITKLITDIIVTPLFLDIEQSIFNDFGVILIIALALYKLISKVKSRAAIPNDIGYFSIVYSVVYIYYRNQNNSSFSFVNSYFFEWLKVMDYFQFFLLGIILLKFSESILNSSLFDTNNSSQNKLHELQTIDEATIITEKNDILNRLKIVESIEETIVSKSSSNESYPIGIVAEWGNGKTTILKTLINRFEENPDYITIEFNPWKCSSPEKVIETFFKLLKEKLSPYSFTINNKIGEYLSSMTTISEGDLFISINKLFEKFTKEQNLEDQYDKIKKEIVAIGRKIIITIDDLDRLNKKEIYEVIRLIRNSANFPNVFFIVAYDRTYVTKAVEEINTHKSHLFLEKIFQIEITLNPIKFETIKNELFRLMALQAFLKGKSNKGFDYFIKQSIEKNEIGSLINRKIPFIKNLRDVKRFLNSFVMQYKIIGDEIYIPDLILLELIRFKTPEFYDYFKDNYLEFVTESKSTRISGDINPNIIVLIDLEKDKETTKLEDYLKNHPEKESIIEIMKILFIGKTNSFTIDKEQINEHLSISYPSKISRYFDWDLNGALSNQHFDKIRNKSLEDFKQSITELCIEKRMILNLRERFQQIQLFESSEDFKKVVQTIFHFANLDTLEETGIYGRKYIGYESIYLLKLFNRESVIKNFFDKKPENLKAFLKSLFETDSELYYFNNDFVTYLYEKEFQWVSHLFTSRNELLDIVFSNFKNAIKRSTKLMMPLIWHYNNCQSKGLEVRYTENPARELLKNFVIENDIDGFIRICIDKNLSDNYQLNSKFLFDVMGGRDVSEDFFANPEVKSIYREEFSKLIKNTFTVGRHTEEGFPRDYFKIIPVDLPFFVPVN